MYFRNIVEQLSKRQIYINLKIKKFNTFNTFIFEKYFQIPFHLVNGLISIPSHILIFSFDIYILHKM